MARKTKVVVETMTNGETDRSYKVKQLNDRIEPHVGSILSEKQLRNLMDERGVTVTVK